MTVALGGRRTTLRASASFAANTEGGQFLFATVDADGRGTVSAEGAQIYGIGQTKPTAVDQGWAVQIDGESKLLINGNVNEGDRLRADANGGGTATATNLHEYGAIAREAGASGAYIAVLVTPGGQISA